MTSFVNDFQHSALLIDISLDQFWSILISYVFILYDHVCEELKN